MAKALHRKSRTDSFGSCFAVHNCKVETMSSSSNKCDKNLASNSDQELIQVKQSKEVSKKSSNQRPGPRTGWGGGRRKLLLIKVEVAPLILEG